MKASQYAVRSLAHAAGVFVYVAAVAWLLFNAPGVLGKEPSFLGPLFALLLFIVSATITGLLVLGKPLQLYLDGRKTEAIALLMATLGWLVAFLAGVVAVMLLT